MGESTRTVRLGQGGNEAYSEQPATYAAVDGYQLYSNDEGQSLLIQQDISVIFM